MPYLSLKTNVAMPVDLQDRLLEALTQLIVDDLAKPRDYVQVHLEPTCRMRFAGTDAPTAFVEVRSLGLTSTQAKTLSAHLASVLGDHLATPADRVFVNFFDVPRPMWGWNADTFG